MKSETPAIKVFEYGQQVRVEGYQALGVVSVGNKQSAENGFDTVHVAMGTQELVCSTKDVEATGVQMFHRAVCGPNGWTKMWVDINKRVRINGLQLFPVGFVIYGRSIIVHVPKEMVNWSREQLLEHMAEQLMRV